MLPLSPPDRCCLFPPLALCCLCGCSLAAAFAGAATAPPLRHRPGFCCCLACAAVTCPPPRRRQQVLLLLACSSDRCCGISASNSSCIPPCTAARCRAALPHRLALSADALLTTDCTHLWCLGACFRRHRLRSAGSTSPSLFAASAIAMPESSRRHALHRFDAARCCSSLPNAAAALSRLLLLL